MVAFGGWAPLPARGAVVGGSDESGSVSATPPVPSNDTPSAPGLPPATGTASAAGGLVRPLWELGVGVAGLRWPDYRGSDESTVYALPLPYVVYRGTWLRADREGARALLLESTRVKIDVSVAAAAPTRSRDNAARRGMDDLAPSAEIGPNLNVELLSSADRRVRLDLRLPLRAALAVQRRPKSIGVTFSPNLNLDVQGLAGGWNLGVQGGPLYGDRKYHAYYYEVGAADATPSRPAYEARAGYAGWRALAAVSRRVQSTWIGAFVRYDRLGGAVFADSPLVRRTSNFSAGLGVSWVFATSGQLVRVPD